MSLEPSDHIPTLPPLPWKPGVLLAGATAPAAFVCPFQSIQHPCPSQDPLSAPFTHRLPRGDICLGNAREASALLPWFNSSSHVLGLPSMHCSIVKPHADRETGQSPSPVFSFWKIHESGNFTNNGSGASWNPLAHRSREETLGGGTPWCREDHAAPVFPGSEAGAHYRRASPHSRVLPCLHRNTSSGRFHSQERMHG